MGRFLKPATGAVLMALLFTLTACEELFGPPDRLPKPPDPGPPVDPGPPAQGRTGGVAMEREAYRTVFRRRAPAVKLPSSFNVANGVLQAAGEYTAEAGFPAVGNQEGNDCVSWAVAYASKTYQEWLQRGGRWSGRGNQDIMSPAYLYYYTKIPKSRCGPDRDRFGTCGSYIETALGFLAETGVASWHLWPYYKDLNKEPNNAAHREAGSYKIGGFWGIEGFGDDYDHSHAINQIKSWLVDRKPVVVGMYWCDDVGRLDDDNPIYDTYPDNYTDRKVCGRHAVAMVGYDDDRSAFKFINSHGQNWGIDHGYGWIDYGASEDLIYEAWSFSDDGGVKPEPPSAPKVTFDLYDTDKHGSVKTTLEWGGGSGADSFDLYLIGATYRNEIQNYFQGNVRSRRKEMYLQRASGGGPFTYAWRVASRGAEEGYVRGPVWEFTVPGEAAPVPLRWSGPVADQTYTVGQRITSLTLPTLIGGEPPVVYALWPAVPGLTFNSSTRTLSGTPTRSGTYSMRYTAADFSLDSVSLRFTITVRQVR